MRAGRVAVEFAGEFDAVDGMDEVEECDGVPGFVGLEVTNEVPAGAAGDEGNLRFGFLDFVFAEGGEAGGEGLVDDFGGDGLGHADEEDVAGDRGEDVGEIREHAGSVRRKVALAQACSIIPRMLIQVLATVLTEFSVGSLLAVSLLPTRQIRVGFFTLNSLLCAIAAGLALVLTKYGLGTAWWDVRYFGLTVIGATVAYGCFKLDRLDAGRVFLILSGLLGLLCGLLPLAEQNLAARALETKAPSLFEVSLLIGAALFGATNVGMILGHWYLLMRNLSFEYLEQFAKLLIGTVIARGVWIGVILLGMKSFDPVLAPQFIGNLSSADAHLFFFILRLLFGVVGPLVLGLMVLRCVRERANQAATGLLYVAEISVLFGEMFAAVLLI